MRFKIWYIPQIPGKAFEKEFDNLIEAVRSLSLIIDYSIFEFNNRIKPDYADAAGVVYWDSNDQYWYDLLFEDLEYDVEIRESFGVGHVWDNVRQELEAMLR